ncbi:MAG: HNH endonuclease [Anaerolineales bacterium]|nr:HNH endonuclease [Anaerolineales bacterium]
MGITLKRQLNDSEKQIILERHGRICFATGHAIPTEDKVHFDHIKAYSLGGPSELDNIAPMCEFHNKAKGMLPLEDYRIRLRLEAFFERGDRLTLRDLLKYLNEEGDIHRFGESVAAELRVRTIKLSNHLLNEEYPVQQCPRTGWRYFYGNLPIEILNSDDDDDANTGLQPRYLIFDKVFEMFRHFQTYPVLQPSMGRLFGDKILLFDGQHKAAALLWNGRKTFECKIYIDPDVRVLNQANISAHDKFAQTRFFSSIMILKLGNQFGKDFDEYRNREDIQTKSELGFLEFLEQKDASLTRAERNRRFRSYLYNSILEDESNMIKGLISVSNRSSNEQPITIDMLSKSIFSCFLNSDPVSDDMLSDKYKRETEFKNLLVLINQIYDLALCSWNAKAAPNDQNQIKLARLFSSKAIMAWCELFKDAVCAKLEIHDSDEKSKPFYRDMSDAEFARIKAILERLFQWQMWKSPRNSEIDTVIAGSKSAVKEWFRSKGLTTGFLMGADI